MQKKKVLVFETLDNLTRHVVRCLADAGIFEIHLLSSRPGSIFRYSRLVKRVHHVEVPSNPAERLASLKAFLRRERMDVLLPVNVDEIEFLINHADGELRSLVHLVGLPSNESFHTACSKLLLAPFMEKHGIPHPAFLVFDPGDSSMGRRLGELSLPVIIKFAWGGGGSGMRVFEDRAELLPFLHANYSPENPIIVQEFLSGTDFGCAVICREGEVLQATMQRKVDISPVPFSPMKGMVFLDDPKILDLVRRLMAALHWNGIAQIDLLVNRTSGEVCFLEINPRYWGSLVASLRMGVNFPEIACRLALGLPVPPPVYRKGRYITPHGYFLYLKGLLAGRKWEESFRLSDTNVMDLITDPVPMIAAVFKRLIPR